MSTSPVAVEGQTPVAVAGDREVGAGMAVTCNNASSSRLMGCNKQSVTPVNVRVDGGRTVSTQKHKANQTR